jgi:peptide/nickel transport system ATP-binding protein
MIFQDPYSSLNPRMTVQKIIEEPLRVNRLFPVDKMEKRVAYLLDCVGLSPSCRNRYPHEFSGGQRQRIGIARAIAAEPKLIVCDEPVSALDVSAQAQIINLLVDLKNEFKLTYLFIAHGLGVVKYISDHVGVMYLGKIIETDPKEELFNRPLHPYTQALLSVNPSIKKNKTKKRILLEGDIPSPIDPPPGCRFATRCPQSCGEKKATMPALREVEKGHLVACHRYP